MIPILLSSGRFAQFRPVFSRQNVRWTGLN